MNFLYQNVTFLETITCTFQTFHPKSLNCHFFSALQNELNWLLSLICSITGSIALTTGSIALTTGSIALTTGIIITTKGIIITTKKSYGVLY